MILLAAGCASLAPPGSRAHAQALPGDSLEDYIRKVRRLSIALAPKRPQVRSMEAEDPGLRAALEAVATDATPAAHRRAAELYRRAGVLDKAYDHYMAARALDRHDAAAYEGLARIWRDWGLPHLGLGDAKRAAYYAPRWATAQNTLGTLLYALGQRTEARYAFQRALALDSGAAYAWTNLCYQSFQGANLTEAAASCRRALAIEPGLAAAHHNLALVYAAAGDLAAARRELLAGNADEAVRHFNTGVLLSASRRYLEAASSFETAHRLRPEWRHAADRARQARRLAE
jgi:tetratricopeptide (TPR) repeat protein